MSTTNAVRLREKTERLEIPDAPISTSDLQSVETACHKFLQKRGMIYNWWSFGTRLVKKEAGANKTKEAAERCAESGTSSKPSDSDEQAASMIIR